MFDAKRLAFEIDWPTWKYRPWPEGKKWSQLSHKERRRRNKFSPHGQRTTLVEIWHHDPCSDGSDNSCGYTFARLTTKQMRHLEALAHDESHHPYFLARPGEKAISTRHELECIYRGLILQVAHHLRIDVSFDEAAKMAAIRTHNAFDPDIGYTLAFKPGYHSNSEHDTKDRRAERMMQIASCIARELLTARRPWYRHPGWHIHHWRIRLPVVRSAISRIRRIWENPACPTKSKKAF